MANFHSHTTFLGHFGEEDEAVAIGESFVTRGSRFREIDWW